MQIIITETLLTKVDKEQRRTQRQHDLNSKQDDSSGSDSPSYTLFLVSVVNEEIKTDRTAMDFTMVLSRAPTREHSRAGTR